jgi:nucleotide-binding universal stress UspA family protein
MFTTIAVATDGSDTADRAVEVALDLAERCDAKLMVLSAYAAHMDPITAHAVSDAPEDVQWRLTPSGYGEDVTRRVVELARERGVACESRLLEGEPAQAICDLAADCHADLLVVGNRGMKRRILGSVPNAISHHAPCAVLIAQTS